MRGLIEQLASRALFALDPETAHEMSITGLRSGLYKPDPPKPDPRLQIETAGLRFPNPLGMAAGYDKNAEVPDQLLNLGFGFAEVGTVTPKPQPGNPKPRIFRLHKDRAVINRLGFNNQGIEACKKRLRRRSGNDGIVGINVGANKHSTDRVADYVAGISSLAPYASYVTVNVSSPNTPGLRDLQGGENLPQLLSAVSEARNNLANPVPVFLKIAPDLEIKQLEAVVFEVQEKRIDGLIVSNTTLSREDLQQQAHKDEAGGLSGRPLMERSTIMLAKTRKIAGPDLPIIGVGGVDSAKTALTKIRAGADLVQLYTGMIYAGPGLPSRIVRGFSEYLDAEGLKSLGEIRDTETAKWAAKNL